MKNIVVYGMPEEQDENEIEKWEAHMFCCRSILCVWKISASLLTLRLQKQKPIYW